MSNTNVNVNNTNIAPNVVAVVEQVASENVNLPDVEKERATVVPPVIIEYLPHSHYFWL